MLESYTKRLKLKKQKVLTQLKREEQIRSRAKKRREALLKRLQRIF